MYNFNFIGLMSLHTLFIYFPPSFTGILYLGKVSLCFFLWLPVYTFPGAVKVDIQTQENNTIISIGYRLS